ncbi:MAG TPA: DUF5654 family protein [Candidatus Paceibacterota bacterium]|nr:DUF5654 family protein [Candidatus Paceibacterota bacterium]
MKERIKEEGSKLSREVRERTTGYIVAALSLVAGLAWNDAIKSMIEYAFPLSDSTITAKLLYAVLMTLFIVVITVYMVRFLGKEENK